MEASHHSKSLRQRLRADLPLDEALRDLCCVLKSGQKDARPLPLTSQSRPLTPQNISRNSRSRSLTDFKSKSAFPKGAAWTPTHEQWIWFHNHVSERFDARRHADEQWGWFSRNRPLDRSEHLDPRLYTGTPTSAASTASREFPLFNRNRDHFSLRNPSSETFRQGGQSGQETSSNASATNGRKKSKGMGISSGFTPSPSGQSANVVIEDPAQDECTSSDDGEPDLSEALLARKLGLPFSVLHEACIVFKQFSNYSKTGLLRKSKLDMDNFGQVLCHVCSCSSVDKLDADFVDEHFRSADRDGDGSVDVEEFCIWHGSAAFAEDLNLAGSDHEIRRISRRLGLTVVDVEKIHAMFKKFDLDGSGLIEFEEFVQVLYQLLKVPQGQVLPSERVSGLWREADCDGSGEIDFEEFCTFYTNRFGDNPFMEDFDFSSFYKNVRRVSRGK